MTLGTSHLCNYSWTADGAALGCGVLGWTTTREARPESLELLCPSSSFELIPDGPLVGPYCLWPWLLFSRSRSSSLAARTRLFSATAALPGGPSNKGSGPAGLGSLAAMARRVLNLVFFASRNTSTQPSHAPRRRPLRLLCPPPAWRYPRCHSSMTA